MSTCLFFFPCPLDPWAPWPLSSALGVLEALAGARLPVFLAFLLAIVAGQEACLLEHPAALRILRDQRAGDAVAHGLCLRAVTAAAHGGASAVFVIQLQRLEGLAHDHARRGALEILVGGLAVDGDRAIPFGAEPDARDGGLAFSSGVLGSSFGHDDIDGLGRAYQVRGCGC